MLEKTLRRHRSFGVPPGKGWCQMFENTIKLVRFTVTLVSLAVEWMVMLLFGVS